MTTGNSDHQVAEKRILKSLWEADLKTALSAPAKSFAQANTAHPDTFARAVRGLYRQLFDQAAKYPADTHLATAKVLLTNIEREVDSPHVRFLRGTIALYAHIIGPGLTQALNDSTSEPIANAVRTYITSEASAFQTPEAKLAAANMLGKIHSLDSRETAARQFDDVRTLDHHGLIEHFYLDTGAKTYFSAPQLTDNSKFRATAIQSSITAVETRSPGSTIGVLVSMDEAFHRIYSPMLYFLAQQCPEVDFCFLLCGTEPTARECINDGIQYVRSMHTLNRSGIPENIHHYQIPLPEYVEHEPTFYASARFFASQLMLERYSGVYLMDADLTTNADPVPYLRRATDLDFATPKTKGLMSLHPWRRFMAGNVALNRRVLETPVLDDLQQYLAFGLDKPFSWALDQNALAYTAENNSSSFSDLTPYRRPFNQPPFRLAWERRYRKQQ